MNSNIKFQNNKIIFNNRKILKQNDKLEHRLLKNDFNYKKKADGMAINSIKRFCPSIQEIQNITKSLNKTANDVSLVNGVFYQKWFFN